MIKPCQYCGQQINNKEEIEGWYYEADGKSFIFYSTGKKYPDGLLYASSEVLPKSVRRIGGVSIETAAELARETLGQMEPIEGGRML